MRIELGEGTREELYQLYIDSPGFLDSKGQELVDSFLYHLSQGMSFAVRLCEGSLVLTTIKDKPPWKR